MKPLLPAVVALCLIIASQAQSEDLEDIKVLPQDSAPIVEAEESEPQIREERCTTCKGGVNLKLKSPNDVLAALQALPGGEVHTQSSFEGCSSDKGCAGLKVKDGQVIERFGNVDAFRAAAASDTGNEFSFHAAGSLGNVLQGGIPKDGPFWWMNENSPFKSGASGGGGSFEKFSQSSSSFSSSGGAGGAGAGGAGAGGAGAGGAGFGAKIDLSANPFLNGDFSKLAGSAGGFGLSAQGAEAKPGFQSSSFESSSSSYSSSNKGDLDLSKNPYLNGAVNKFGASGSGFQAQGGFASGSAGQGPSQFGASGQGGQAAFGAQGARGQGTQFGAQGGQFGSQGSQSAFSSNSNSQSSFGAGARGTGAGGFGAGGSGQGSSGSGSQFGASGSQFGAGQSGFNAAGSSGQGAGQQGFNGGASQSSFSQSSQSSYTGTGQNLGGQGANNQAGFAGNAGFSGSKFAGAGYTGSTPGPFTASTAGSNVNLIQNSQKTSEFDFEQQQQTQSNIDEAFQGTGNVQTHQHAGGDLQQTCAGQGYVCVHKAQCNNGVVNSNGASVLQAKTKKQYCNTRTEICCRIEVSTLAGANDLQGSLGFGSATFNANSNANRQGGLFVSSNQGASSSSFGAGQTTQSGQAGFGGSQSGQAGFGASQSGSNFGATGQRGAFGAASGTFGQGQSSFGSSSFGASNRGSTFGQGSQGFGAQGGAQGGFAGSANRESSSSTFESSTRGAGFGSTGSKFGAGASFGIGSTVAPTASRFGGNEVVYKQTSQSNFIEKDSFSAGSENTGVFRPGASGSGLKPGIPYLPPDNPTQPTNIVPSTAYPTTPRPFTTPRPTYLPPSTSAPGYLPPQGEQSINRETRLPGPPTYIDGQLILEDLRNPRPTPRPPPPPPSEVPSGCAAALKCTPIEYCTAEGVMSNTTVALTRDQEAYRVPLTDCKDVETGRVGKCCRDPYYTDPWPTNQLGKWVPGVFGGNDGKYVSDSRGSPSVNRPAVTARPPVTGSTLLNNYRNTPKPTVPSFGPNQVTPGYASTASQSFGQKGQFEVRQQGQFGQGGQGQYSQAGQGQVGQGQAGQFSQGSQFSQNSFSQTQRGQGQAVTTGQGQAVTTGQGQAVTTGQGQAVTAGQGQYSQQGQSQYSQQSQGQYSQGGQGQYSQGGQGQYSQGGRGQLGIGGQVSVQGQASQFQRDQNYAQSQRGQAVLTGQGQGVLTGQGQAITQGFGQGIRQGQGFSVENEYSESSQRVFLQQYSAGGQCGLFNGQKPFGNRNELEVDFAEIPWQAMVLLQTNKSLLCGGVITRPDVVVTSAACVEGLQAKNVLIKGGEWKLGIDDEPLPFQIVQVKHILRHPFYKRGSLHFDAAILVLSENLRLAQNIYPICLPRASDTLDAFYNGAGECIVTGWGKQVLQAHLAGAIMHSLNVSLINPGECQAKLSQDYPHLLEQYDQESCACGQPTNPINNICRVDTGSALACTTGDGHWTLRGVYSWDSACQAGDQLAAFYKFDLEWYEWAIGLLESARFAQFGGSSSSQQRYTSGVKGGAGGGIKGGFQAGLSGVGGNIGFGQFNQFSSKFSEASSSEANSKFNSEISAPITNSFSASYSEKKVFQSEPKIVTYTTKPEIFTYTTKPKLVTYTTKPQIITYETSGSATNPQFVAPGVTFNPSFSELVGAHKHNAACKCLDGKK